MRTFVAIVCVCAWLFDGVGVSAQPASGAIQGRVVDPAGASVAGVTVRATNVETGVESRTISRDDGGYIVLRVAPGRYTLAAERDGFTKEVVTDVVVTVGQVVVRDFALQLGAVTDTVTVVAPATDVQRRTSAVSDVVGERRVRELPLNGKDFNKLVVLAPGVVATPASTAGSPAVSGARTTANNYTLDGVSTNDERVDGLPPGGGFAAVGNALPNIISTEAIQEFRVITSNADATNGRGSGGQINIVTRSGTNQLQGSTYAFGRHDALDARDFFNSGPYFDDRGRATNPPFRQALFGASVGGPIARRRHFFFVNGEGVRQRRDSITSLTLMNADLLNLIPGDLGRLYRATFIGSGVVPATGNPAGSFTSIPAAQRAAAIAGGFPAHLFDGQANNGEAGTVLVSTVTRSDYDQSSFLARTDHQLSDGLRLTARYAFNGNEAVSGVVTDQIREPRRWHSFAVESSWAVGPNQLLEIRGGRQQTRNATRGANAVDANLAALGVDPETGIFVSASGTGSRFIRIRGANAIINDQPSTSLVAQHTWTRGPVTVRTGLDLRHVTTDFRSNIDLPSYDFFGFVGPTGVLGSTFGQPQAIADSAGGVVYGRTVGPATPKRSYASLQQEYYAQADWQVAASLTLNLGLRYSYFGVYRERDDLVANLFAVTTSGAVAADVSPFAFGRTANAYLPVSDDRPLYQPDRNNLQPRLGGAWDLAGRGRTILRAAYGRYYDRLTVLEFSDIVGNTPFAFSTDAIEVPFRLGQPIPLEEDVISGVSIDPTLRNPSTDRVNVAVEQRVTNAATISVGYVGARARDLVRRQAMNAVGSVPLARRPDPRFGDQGLVTNASSSQYDALQAIGRYRRSGLDVTAYYTFARSLDDVSAGFGFSGAGPALVNLGATSAAGFQGGGSQFVDRPVKADWGPSNFDVRHQFVLTHLVDLPFGRGRRFLDGANRFVDGVVGGWSLAGTLLARSGLPFSVTLGADVNDDGATDDRPALLAGDLGDLYASGSRTQFLVPQVDARTRLGVPGLVTDPFASIRRNAFRSPAVSVYDLSLIKRVPVAGRATLQLELNAFNLFNRANFNAPISDLSNVRFGLITSTLAGSHGAAGNPRQLQLGAKLTF